MAITQRHIAAAANVSRSTVAAVMSEAQCDRISLEVRTRVLATAEKLGYRPNRYAQIMRNGKSGMIGVIDFEPLHQLSQRKVLATAKAILREGYEPVAQEALWFSKEGGDAGQAACQRMLDLRVEGAILVHPSPFFRQEYLDPLLKSGVPVVAIGGAHLRDQIPCFVSDREWGYQVIAEHLLKLGYRRLAVLATEDGFAESGVRRALKEAGGAAPRIFHPAPIRDRAVPQEIVQHLRGKYGMCEILARKPYPEAVICNNDDWALGALDACVEAGLRVPEEIALTGFDNIAAAQFGAVPITTVAQPVDQISKEAVQTLLAAMRKKRPPKPSPIRISGELIVRRSCGAALRKNGVGD